MKVSGNSLKNIIPLSALSEKYSLLNLINHGKNLQNLLGQNNCKKGLKIDIAQTSILLLKYVKGFSYTLYIHTISLRLQYFVGHRPRSQKTTFDHSPSQLKRTRFLSLLQGILQQNVGRDGI